MIHRARVSSVLTLLVLSAALLTSGCVLFGIVSTMAPPQTIDAAYKGLGKQNTAVMVWSDRAMTINWPRLQEDLSRGITMRIQAAAGEKKPAKFLEGATFALPESVTRFQHDHPENDTQDIAVVAPKMSVSRLIYIEVVSFDTRPESSLELYRGTITVNLKVLEVSDAPRAKVAYQKDDIKLKFPEKGPDEGSPGLTDALVYEKTIEACATEIAHVFVPYTAPDNN